MNEIDGSGTGSGRDRIIINCGGVRHETFRSTLRNFPDTRLAWCTENTANNPDFNPDKQEFFFDRHPGVFAQIINYYRTGKLHTPNDVCGPLFEEELGFWGIDEKQMEPCCWANYTQHREAQENLKVFEGADMSDDEAYDDDMYEANASSYWQKYRPKIWSIMEDFRSSRMAKIMVAVSMTFIVLSVSAYCFKTLKAVKNSETIRKLFFYVELICGVWFTFEFGLRLASSPNKREFLIQPMNWVDFLAILPFYLDFVPGITDSAIEILALIRLMRLFRFFKLNLGLQILKHTMVASMRELFLLVLLIMIPVVLFASAVYLTEKDDNLDKFESIPEAFWWAVITITTVGYGDIVPKTTMGKIFGALCAACSVIITALPISIIGSNFSLYYAHAQARLKLPKKARRALVGAANALVSQSARPSDDMSNENGDNFPDEQTPSRRSTMIYNGSVATGDGGPPGGYRSRARRTRSSLYAGGMVPISRPSRTRSNEELISGGGNEIQTPPQTDRKKSQTSTQSTLLETPPKSPPHYGHTLTVDPPSIDETVTNFQCLLNEDDNGKENLDPEDEAIEEEFSRIHKSPVNGVPRPGTPVRRSRNRVGFVKPTLTVTLDIGDRSEGAVNENIEEDEDEDTFHLSNQTKNDNPNSRKKWTNFRSGEVSPMSMNDRNGRESGT